MTAAQTSQSTLGGQQAIVIGSSMAGLLAARVLSEHFAQVTIRKTRTLSRWPDRGGQYRLPL